VKICHLHLLCALSAVSHDKMLDTLRSSRQSHEVDMKANDVTHLEKTTTRTPPSEMEKGNRLVPVASRGPEVHEKVS
jgi:hypothetical protein